MEAKTADFLTNVAQGHIDSLDTTNISQETLNTAIYVASTYKQSDAVKFLLNAGADTESIPAQLSLVQARIQKNITLCLLLSNTPTIPADQALYYAFYYDQFDLAKNIVERIVVDPTSDFLKLTYADAFMHDKKKNLILLSLFNMPKVAMPEALVLSCKYVSVKLF